MTAFLSDAVRVVVTLPGDQKYEAVLISLTQASDAVLIMPDGSLLITDLNNVTAKWRFSDGEWIDLDQPEGVEL